MVKQFLCLLFNFFDNILKKPAKKEGYLAGLANKSY